MVRSLRAAGPAALAVAAAAAVIAAPFGCDSGYTPQHLVRGLRILAVQVEAVGSDDRRADALAGEQVRVEALAVDGAVRPDLRVEWRFCFPAELDQESPCADPLHLVDPTLLDGEPGVVVARGSPAEVTVPPELSALLASVARRAQQDAAEACRGFLEVPVVVVATAGDEREVALDVMRLVPPAAPAPDRDGAGAPGPAYARNHNPALREVRAAAPGAECRGSTPLIRRCAADADCGGVGCRGGACDDPRPRGAVELCAVPEKGSAEEIACQGDGADATAAEGLKVQWHATGGELESPQGEPGLEFGIVVGHRVTFRPPAGPFRLWAVIRDGRGGEGWLAREFP